MLRKCDYCKKDYNASPYELRRGKGRFCSQSCALKSRNPLGLKFKEVPIGDFKIEQIHPLKNPSVVELQKKINEIDAKHKGVDIDKDKIIVDEDVVYDFNVE